MDILNIITAAKIRVRFETAKTAGRYRKMFYVQASCLIVEDDQSYDDVLRLTLENILTRAYSIFEAFRIISEII